MTDIIYKLQVNDRNYTSWTVYETTHFTPVEITSIEPISTKMFSNDFFKITSENKVEIIHSSTRSNTIPGVLLLDGNKTYGRKNGKLLYKCLPDDLKLPAFLIPYELKQIGFSKVFVNLYVTFHFVDWNEKHPHGQLSQVIGPVNLLDHFYEYQLYCKSLHVSLQKFQKDTSKALQKNSHDAFINSISAKHPSIQNRTDPKWFVFSIDPSCSLDFDDAFSIQPIQEDGTQLVSIYIANVTVWLDVLNLWDSFSKRISTIYLPDRKRPMLPSILSDCLCSLQINCSRIAFVMDVTIKEGEIKDVQYHNAVIRVSKNYVYEDAELLTNIHYTNLMNCTKQLVKKYRYLRQLKDSHDLVSYWMILMNNYCAQEMVKYKNGIFRSMSVQSTTDSIDVPSEVPEEVAKFIQIMKHSSGQYINGKELEMDSNINMRHHYLELDNYIHITSPIRRLVDLLNIIQLQQNLGILQLSEKATAFYKRWLQDLDYINVTMQSIRKVQMDCSMLDLCVNHPKMMEKEYDGYVFDKLVRKDGLYQYNVFLPELKLSSRLMIRDDIKNYSVQKFRLYLFHNEEKFKKKIRLQMI
jgi:exoribonuclease R